MKYFEEINIRKFEDNIESVNINTISIKILKFSIKNINKVFEIFNNDISNSSIYIFKWEDDEGNLKFYVGQTDDFIKRFKTHNKMDNLINEIIIIFSTDNSFKLDSTKRLYFEYLFIDKIKKQLNNKIKLENKQTSFDFSKYKSDEDYIIKYYFNIMIKLISILDFNFFSTDENVEIYNNPINSPKKLIEVFINYNKNKISCFFNKDSNLIILKKNTLIANPKNNKYISNKILENLDYFEENGNFYLNEGLVFTSPSSAANLITGSSSNGWIKFYLENNEKLNIFRN